MNSHHQQTPTPPPPTEAERYFAWQQRQHQPVPQSADSSGVWVLVMLGIAAWVGAALAYMWAVGSIEIDNVFMSGDQSTAANYAPAIFLGVAGAFLFLVAAILGSRRS